MLTDKELVRRAARGDRRAFERIYQNYRNDLLTIAMNLTCNAGLAEDVVQDVFVRFIYSLEKFHLRGSLKAYLAICVANKSRDVLRKQNIRQNTSLNEFDPGIESDCEPLRMVINNEQLHLLEKGIAALPFEQREVIMLRIHGNMSYRLIADVLEVPLKTAHSRYRYGIDKLRDIFSGRVEL